MVTDIWLYKSKSKTSFSTYATSWCRIEAIKTVAVSSRKELRQLEQVKIENFDKVQWSKSVTGEARYTYLIFSSIFK